MSNKEISNLMATFKGDNDNDMLLLLTTEVDIKFTALNPKHKMTPRTLSESIVNWVLEEMNVMDNFYTCVHLKKILGDERYKLVEVEPLVHMFSQVQASDSDSSAIHIIVLKMGFDHNLQFKVVVSSSDDYTNAVFKEVEAYFNKLVVPQLLRKIEGM